MEDYTDVTADSFESSKALEEPLKKGDVVYVEFNIS